VFLTKIAILPVLCPGSFAALFTLSLPQRRRLVPTQMGAFGGHWCVPGCVRVLPHAGRERNFVGAHTRVAIYTAWHGYCHSILHLLP
jgi:hypothetical protein